MPVVVFDPFAFKIRYPEFNNVPNNRLGMFFQEATLYLSNAPNSPVQCLSRRTTLLNMLTAHVAFLAGALSPTGQPAPVGRVSDATEGSVSVSLNYTEATPGSGPWFNQTQYGASFWQATTNLRGFKYIPFLGNALGFRRIY